MKKNIFYLFLLLTVTIFGCSEFSSEQQALLDKKWYNSDNWNLKFNSDNNYVINYPNKWHSNNYRFNFLDSNKIVMLDQYGNISSTFFYCVKDSILYTVSAEDTMKLGNSLDTNFYHLNSKYESWQTRELLYFGKIISDYDPMNPPPD